MKKLLAVLAVLAIVLVAVAFWRNWFSVGTTPDSGKTHIDLTVNKD